MLFNQRVVYIIFQSIGEEIENAHHKSYTITDYEGFFLSLVFITFVISLFLDIFMQK